MKFLSALAADGTIPDVEGIISSNLSAGFDSLKESVTDSITRQGNILASVQVCRIVSCDDIAFEGTQAITTQKSVAFFSLYQHLV